MLFYELLLEKGVTSTWIVDLSYNRNTKVLTMTLNNKNQNRRYHIHNVSRRMFDYWQNSPSKGQFFHQRIKGNYKITRAS